MYTSARAVAMAICSWLSSENKSTLLHRSSTPSVLLLLLEEADEEDDEEEEEEEEDEEDARAIEDDDDDDKTPRGVGGACESSCSCCSFLSEAGASSNSML